MTVRSTAATTLQALELTNGQTLDHRLKAAVEPVTPAAAKDPAAWIAKTWRHAIGRPPTAAEIEIGKEMLGKPVTADGVADLLWAVMMLPEFQFVN